MRRAELRDELERLGSRPVPLPDPRRVDAIEDHLYQEFVVTPASSGAALLAARRRRRLVMVGGLGAAAAATFAAVVLHRGSTPGFELQAASGAVALFPDGASRPVHAGDQIPPGGLIQTGPSGAVTIDGTKIGPDQVVLLSDEGLTLLPSHSKNDQARHRGPALADPLGAARVDGGARGHGTARGLCGDVAGACRRPGAVQPRGPAGRPGRRDDHAGDVGRAGACGLHPAHRPPGPDRR